MDAASVVVRVLELRTAWADKVDKAKGRHGVEQIKRGDSEVTEREKVMKGLSLCKWSNAGLYEGFLPEYEVCNKCPYARDDFEVDECCAELMRDALELLKAQKPRVLTLEEVKQFDYDYCYLEEERSPGKEYRTVCGRHKVTCITWPSITQMRMVRKDDTYGKTWRCWSAKPTDDQRKAVKWDAAD